MIDRSKIETINLNFYYGNFKALKNINIKIPSKNITAIIGPSGCGKSTLLRCFNRMNDIIENTRCEGKVLIDNQDINSPRTDLVELRKKVGMVFQRPYVFNLSIYENLVFGIKIHRLLKKKSEIGEAIKNSLESVGLWQDIKDKLKRNAKILSLEQQQRLCIARVLILKPEIILLDEPCSTLDPIATTKIEELLLKLKENYTIVIVTHNMQQAARISQFCGFMLLGELVEFDVTNKVFTSPQDIRTENYITGKFG
ncbi:MAG: phosphate ABC transporter ATP-binding protein [Candidatus Omnitrophica bacterium 4484_70.2]|nr:MAG: phosphate ABC transporter ATP-binding protein [Candidatus Omnitrophica bacterium 4484_70.2]